MNKELRDKWISALRSGKYKQGTGRLRNVITNQYCCLGVLSEILSEEGIEDSDWEWKYDRWIYRDDNTYIRTNLMPIDISNKIGLGYKQAYDLAVMNDLGITFNKIADSIEENNL